MANLDYNISKTPFTSLLDHLQPRLVQFLGCVGMEKRPGRGGRRCSNGIASRKKFLSQGRKKPFASGFSLHSLREPGHCLPPTTAEARARAQGGAATRPARVVRFFAGVAAKSTGATSALWAPAASPNQAPTARTNWRQVFEDGLWKNCRSFALVARSHGHGGCGF